LLRLLLRCYTTTDNHPIIVHCVKGKDRTGLVAALVQSVLGDARETIVADYAASDRLLRLNPNEKVLVPDGVARKGKIDWANFQGTPPEVSYNVTTY
jgi:Tyrosine phosphatase family